MSNEMQAALALVLKGIENAGSIADTSWEQLTLLRAVRDAVTTQIDTLTDRGVAKEG